MNNLRVCAILFVLVWFSEQSYTQEATDSLKLALNSADHDTTRINILSDLFWERIYADPAEAKDYLDQALLLVDNVPDSAFRGGIVNLQGVYYWTQSDYSSSLVAFRQALSIFEKIGNQRRISALLNNIGNVYESLGSYDLALDYQIRALRMKEEIGAEPERIANSYMNIGNIHVQMSNYDRAEQYYLMARDIGDSTSNLGMVESANSNLAVIYGNLGEHRKSIDLYKHVVNYNRKEGLDFDLASTLDGLGQEYFAIGELDSALTCYFESKALNEKVENQDLLALNLRNIGETLAAKRQYNDALKYLKESLVISEQLDTRKDLMHDYRVLSRTYKEMGDYKNALENHEKYMEVNFEVFDAEKDQAINELQIRYDIDKKEAEIRQQKERIRILNQEAQIESLRRNLLIGTVIGLIVIGVLVVYGLRQKIKRKEAEQEQERSAYEKELYFKRKELTTHTLHLVQKNDLLEELKQKLTEIRKRSTDSRKELGRMVQLIKSDAIAEKDWENFKRYFQEVHQDFDQKLREQFNDLTANEMRLAALMKMNLTTKEMANILNISPDSVKKARYRLRKKLRLSTDDSLSDFILAL